MKKVHKNKSKKNFKKIKGFTLIELLAIIVIIGILALLGSLAVGVITEKSKKSIFYSNARIIMDSAANIDLTEERSFYSLEDLETLSGNSYVNISPNKQPLEGYVFVHPETKKTYIYLDDGIMSIKAGTDRETKSMIEYTQIEEDNPTDVYSFSASNTDKATINIDNDLYIFENNELNKLDIKQGQKVYISDNNGNSVPFIFINVIGDYYYLIDYDNSDNFYSTNYKYTDGASIINSKLISFNNLEDVTILTVETLSEILSINIDDPESAEIYLTDNTKNKLLNTVFTNCSDGSCSYAIWLASNKSSCLNLGEVYYNANCYFSLVDTSLNKLYIASISPTMYQINGLNLKIKYLYKFSKDIEIYDENYNKINI